MPEQHPWAPDRLFLVDDENMDTGRPWCEERVTQRDVLYVRGDLAGAGAVPGAPWVRVEDRMPGRGVHVLVCFLNDHGNARRVRAMYDAPPLDEDICDLPEGCTENDDGEMFAPLGWYETNEGDEHCWAVHGVTHWTPLPAVPEDEPYGSPTTSPRGIAGGACGECTPEAGDCLNAGCLALDRPRSGHWNGTEERNARYLIAAMTGRTLEEVTEPLSRLLHELRYGRKSQEETRRAAILEAAQEAEDAADRWSELPRDAQAARDVAELIRNLP